MVLEEAGEQQQPELVPPALGGRHASATHTGVVLGARPRPGWDTIGKLVGVRHTGVVPVQFVMYN